MSESRWSTNVAPHNRASSTSVHFPETVQATESKPLGGARIIKVPLLKRTLAFSSMTNNYQSPCHANANANA
jgi:hypothetical protein